MSDLDSGVFYISDVVDPDKAAVREEVRSFQSGATRNRNDTKPAYEGFLSPHALHAFGEYMHKHRKQADGTLRNADNWQKGIPESVYMDSMLRHVFDLWLLHRGGAPVDPDSGQPCTKKDLLCAIYFNAGGLLHETVKPGYA